MNRRILLAILVLSLIVAGVTGYYGREQLSSAGPTLPLVTALRPIPPSTLITTEMLAVRDMPEPLRHEPVFLTVGEVVGKMTAGPIPAGSLIYRELAVPVESFRLTADPSLEVVSFPARPEKALGGQLRPGQRINVYRVAIGSSPMALSPEQALAAQGAEAELLAARLAVVDVRTGQGESPTSDATTAEERSRSAPPTIITVAVTPEVAREIIALVGETRGSYDFWVTLAPVAEGEQPAIPPTGREAGGDKP